MTEPDKIKVALNAIVKDDLKAVQYRDSISTALSSAAENR